MTDRITPYKPGGDIRERIDEIVAENASVHFEMMAGGRAQLVITSDGVERRYEVFSGGFSLILRLYEEIPA